MVTLTARLGGTVFQSKSDPAEPKGDPASPKRRKGARDLSEEFSARVEVEFDVKN